MPNVAWSLQVHCSNCSADTTFTSELGEKFKLSYAKKEADLYRRAQNWVSRYGNTGHPEGIPENLKKYIMPLYNVPPPPQRVEKYVVLELLQPGFNYVKCPVCRARVYVC